MFWLALVASGGAGVGVAILERNFGAFFQFFAYNIG